MALFGFIGTGNMGYPLMLSAIKAFGRNEIEFYDKSEARRQAVTKETGINPAADNEAMVLTCKYICLVVKPQFIDEVLLQISRHITKDHVIISFAAGISTERIRQGLNDSARIVRAMPNTPAMVGKGMTGVSYDKGILTQEEESVLDRFFNSCGRYEIVDERLMNAVVCVSGSSPAYVYSFIEALADSAVSCGLPRDKAYTMAAQAVLGAAQMVLDTGEHPAKLKDNVCSPGGTTIAAIKALEEHGFRNAIMKATDACYKKAEELG